MVSIGLFDCIYGLANLLENFNDFIEQGSTRTWYLQWSQLREDADGISYTRNKKPVEGHTYMTV